MRGISEERLRELIENDDYYDSGIEKAVIYGLIADECHELDPWLLIEDAPKDRKIKAYNPFIGQYITRYTSGQWPCFGASELDGMKISNEDGASIHYPQPTHYRELSKDPQNS